MPKNREVELLLCANQQAYLERELDLRAANPRIASEEILSDPLYQKLLIEEDRLLELLHHSPEEDPETFSPVSQGREWERRKKYRGRVDGDRQPNAVRVSCRRRQQSLGRLMLQALSN